jgi:Leucine-rich repeat (LRR) protein
VSENREEVRAALQPCFDNFNLGSVIECSYISAEFFPYTCELTISNQNGRNDFERIDGEHAFNLTNDDVLVVEGIRQNSFNVPSIICQQFKNLETLTLEMSRIEVITARSFESCENLKILQLNINNISFIPSATFAHNQHLEMLIMRDNFVTNLSPEVFSGTQLWYVDFGHNTFWYFEPEYFEAINGTLKYLNLAGNGMLYLPNRAFSNLRNLEELELGTNQFTGIPGDAFEGKTN